LEPSHISDHSSAAGSGIEELMTKDDETEGHTMEDMPVAENVPAEIKPVDSEKPDNDESDEKPLDAASQWPRKPSKKDIARLTECSGLDERTSRGYLPVSTAGDVVVNALVSIKFLKEAGDAPLNPDDIGVDSKGRLFKVNQGRHPRHNYRVEFSAMVSNLQENSRYKEIKGHMQAYLAARVRDNEYFGKTKELASLIGDVLDEKAIGIPKLKSVATKCREVVATLDKTITLINAVKQDLLDMGSTSLRRWNQLQNTGFYFYLPKHLDNGGFGIPDSTAINELVEELTEAASLWQAPLGLTLMLLKDLELAIGEVDYS
jgi:hypothetical protein